MSETNDSAFNRSLYSQLARENAGQNLFFSAMSIRTALAMVYAGAVGETREELERVFVLYPDVHRDICETVDALHARSDVDISIANGVWVSNDLPLNDEYKNILQEGYHIEGGVRQDMSAESVNDFVNHYTNGMIQHVIDELDEKTLMVLVNAIYFLGKWEVEFNKDKTNVNGKFYNSDGNISTIPLMNGSMKNMDYIRGENYSAVSIPYRDHKVGMRIILPDLGEFNAVEESYVRGEVQLPNVRGTQEVNLTIPRFKMECSYELPETLISMGAGQAFSDYAQFSKITHKERLKIDQVIHKAVIEVSEEGTEAAAATVVGMVRCNSVRRETHFHVDRPFIFEIFDEVTGSPLFAGRVLNM